MPKILLLGSGFVAGPCIDHLLKENKYEITIASRSLKNAQAACKSDKTTACAIDVDDKSQLESLVSKHDLVISLIPYIHHAKVIAAAVKHKKHVVTTSYVSPAMMEHHQAAIDADVTVFNEIGVDPGVDHLYAVKIIDEVHKKGGKILSFLSYCGGLPAPEASNNPLGYKFSWSSRGVLLALQNAAKFWENGKIVSVAGPDLMDSAKPIFIYPAFSFVGYPNRDSSPYTERYNIPECKDLIRGSLRYQGFPAFIKALVALGFLSTDKVPSLAPNASAITWRACLSKILKCDESKLKDAITQKAKLSGSEATRILSGFDWLGLTTDAQAPLKDNLLDSLCATLEQKMQYEEGERDMVMLQHKFGIEWADGSKETRTSTGLWYGTPNGNTAMV